MEKILMYKYIPKKINDFQLNKETKDLLNTLLKMNNLNILLVGNSGSGKTSIINSLINEYYNELLKEENILYINNLKDQGIQYYRNEVKTFSQTYSVINGKKKSIVLDDIDNINEQSQQVFRNSIDKYKNNVNFICSCSNLQKVIDSLQSRMIIIKLNNLSNANILHILKEIIKNEKIDIDNDTINFLINISNNSLRIMLNYLEKFKILNLKITLDVAKKLCSNICFSEFELYTEYILNSQLNNAIKIFYNLYDNGYSVIDILDNYFIFIKLHNIFNNDTLKYEIIKLLCKYITLFHNLHEDEIELALFSNNLHDVIKNK
jgi:DNA polymerase III delta prime subunit